MTQYPEGPELSRYFSSNRLVRLGICFVFAQFRRADSQTEVYSVQRIFETVRIVGGRVGQARPVVLRCRGHVRSDVWIAHHS